MKGNRRFVRLCVGVCLALLAIGSMNSFAAASAPDRRVLIWGEATDREQQSETMRRLAQNRDRICAEMSNIASHPDVNQAIVQGEFALNGILARLALPRGIQSDVRENFNDGWEEFCNEDLTPAQATDAEIFIVYSHCSMFMHQRDGGGGLSIWLREDMNEAVMLVSDGAAAQAVRMNHDMSRVRRPVPGEQELIGAGRTTSANMSQVGGPRPFPLGRPPAIREYPAFQYNYNYSSSLSGGMMGDAVGQSHDYSGGRTQFPSLAAMTRVETNGTAWISPEVPGVDIINTFYANFAGILESGQGPMSFIAGMLRNQEAITSKGIPLEYEITTSAAMGMRSTSTFKAEDVKVIPARVDECVASLPPGTEVMDMGDLGDMGGSGAPSLPPPSAGGSPSLAPSSAVGGGTASQPTGGSGSAFGAQCADELYSDNMTLMVQRLLQNLGYDPGGLDGKLGVQTMIAISEFQAEKGQEITGEPSPQLAGILSAEVDKRCGI